MKIIIEDHYLSDLATLGKVSGKSPFPDEVVKAFKKRLSEIRQANNTLELRTIKSLHFEKLKGKEYEGKYSIRLNINYRMIFRIENEQDSRIEIICIEEINNHYS